MKISVSLRGVAWQKRVSPNPGISTRRVAGQPDSHISCAGRSCRAVQRRTSRADSGTAAGSASGGAITPSTPTAGYQRYVALGDSYSAGPLIPTTDLAGGCARSDHNYPSLLAARLHVGKFVDATCSGATTGDLSHVQHPFRGASVPPQLHAVTRRSDLVTVGIGGRNIFNVFPDKIATSLYPSTGGRDDGELYPRTGGPFGYNGAFWYARVFLKF